MDRDKIGTGKKGLFFCIGNPFFCSAFRGQILRPGLHLHPIGLSQFGDLTAQTAQPQYAQPCPAQIPACSNLPAAICHRIGRRHNLASQHPDKRHRQFCCSMAWRGRTANNYAPLFASIQINRGISHSAGNNGF